MCCIYATHLKLLYVTANRGDLLFRQKTLFLGIV